ncbi:MAG: selenocysteine-specific translation elongation factor [Bryobacteraceae bacterium]
MKHIIAGTAGHIDHGKSALVRALTGIDPDRLEEEKRRGITIDIGFAHLELTPEIRIGFVDVPGHERFVKNMLAGVGGIDLVLFVIAADESIKPQTREHFDICRLLGIRRGIVVLTKADLVDPDILGLVRLEVEEFVAGSFLESAPIVPVSAKTGEGLDRLKQELTRAAAEETEKDATRWFRLPIDRAFTMRGFGTVVTGTLISGAVAKDDEVELHPLGRRLRVRGVQVHGKAAARAVAGQRTALNLTDIDTSEVARGMTLTHPGLFTDIRQFDAAVDLLDSSKPLRHRAPVHFHAGAAEIEGEIRLFRGQAQIQPGASAWARVVLRDPAELLPGDRFILRRFSPVITIGGGVVVDTSPRRYRAGEEIAQRLALLRDGSIDSRLALIVKESRFGCSRSELIARTGLTQAEVDHASSAPSFVCLRQPEFWLMDAGWFRGRAARLAEIVTAFHKANPLVPGMPKQDLRARELAGAPLFVLDAILAAATHVAVTGDTVHLATHRLVLKEDEQKAREAIESAFAQAGLTTPPVQEVLAKSGVEAGRARSLLQILIREKRLYKISDDLVFHESAIGALRALLAPRKGQRFGVPEFKDWTGISRKYAIPLLEFLDRERLTRRDGVDRVVI